jgi:hypothetical protein
LNLSFLLQCKQKVLKDLLQKLWHKIYETIIDGL